MAQCRSGRRRSPDAPCQTLYLFGQPSVALAWRPPAPTAPPSSTTACLPHHQPRGLAVPSAGDPPGGGGLLRASAPSRFPQAVGRLPESARASFHLPNESKRGQGRAPETPPAAAPLAFVSSPLRSSRYVLIP